MESGPTDTLGDVRDPRLTVIYSPGDEGWVVARIREFPAAMSQGRTRDEARTNVLDALRELVFSYLEEGEPIPVPPR